MRSLKLILTKPLYFGVAWVFASINILIGTWAIYIPEIAQKLAINEGQLGISLFFLAFGTLLGLPVSPYLVGRLGLGRSTIVGISLFCVAFVFPFLATSHIGLSVALFGVGLASGFTDIAMNTLVSELEAKKQVQIMSAAHGFFSLGGVIGAGVGSILSPLFPTPLIYMLVVASLVLVINVLLSRSYVDERSPVKSDGHFSFKHFKPLFALGLVAFIIMASEGAMVDWSGLYLEKVTLAQTALLIGMGYTVFSACMTLGRFFGDYVSNRFGSYAIIIYGLFIGIGGYLLILSGSTLVAIAGFGLVGIGFSVIVPELFRLGGQVQGVASSQGISFIAGSGFLGFLMGPVFLGLLAQYATLRLSFIALLVGAVIATFTMALKKIKGS